MANIGYHHLSPAQRWSIVREIEDEGSTLQHTAQAVGCSVATVKRIVSLFRSTGGIEERHGGGAEHVYSASQMRRLDRLIHKHPHETAAGLRQLMGPSAPHISDRTMGRYRRDLNYSRRRQGILLHDTPQQAAKRRAWVRQHRNDPIETWLFMDESRMVLRHTGDLIWIKRGQDTPPHLISHLTLGVNVWGVVWDAGKVFTQYEGAADQDVIFDCLNDHLSPHLPNIADRTLLANGATFQYTEQIREWYDAGGLVPLKLPPHSPQFNAIERCWGWLKRHVKQAAPQTQAALAAAMTAACQALPQATIVGFIAEAKRNIQDY
jgi:transposase-like protein